MKHITRDDLEEVLFLIGEELADTCYLSSWGNKPPEGTRYAELMAIQERIELEIEEA